MSFVPNGLVDRAHVNSFCPVTAGDLFLFKHISLEYEMTIALHDSENENLVTNGL